MIISNRLCRIIGVFSFVVFFLQVVFSQAIYYGVLNYLGPSTEYYDPIIIGAKMMDDGKYEAVLGDRIFVAYEIARHRINGTCFMHIYRYGEEVGGPHDGRRHLLDYVKLQFVGKDERLRPRWPLSGLVLGYDVNKEGEIQRDKPLLDPGVDRQEFALYVVARYYCNFVDFLFPRYLQGGAKQNETERVNIIIQRRKT